MSFLNTARNYPNTEFFLVRLSRIWDEYGKTRTRKHHVFGLFSHSTSNGWSQGSLISLDMHCTHTFSVVHTHCTQTVCIVHTHCTHTACSLFHLSWMMCDRLLGGNLKNAVTFGTNCFARYSRHVCYLACPLMGGFTV